ncbi:MAG: hypothetical protein HYX63_09870 [Gammaproteobacteria bacterium]|nr:hypothetical protein [Gammaproteobacteria bacterium]
MSNFSNRRCHLRVLGITGWMCAFAPATLADGHAAIQEPRNFLRFETVPDGKCQILSEGGQLVVLRNTHGSKKIRYRLTRYFADKQQGLSTGTVASGGEGQKLGCNKVDGRQQRWQIETAQFSKE